MYEQDYEKADFLGFFHSITFENYRNFQGQNSFSHLSPINVIYGEDATDCDAILDTIEYVADGSCRKSIKVSVEIKTTPDWIKSYSKILVKKRGKFKITPRDFEARTITSFRLRKERKKFNTHPNYNKGLRTTAQYQPVSCEYLDPFYTAEKKYVVSELASRSFDWFGFYRKRFDNCPIESEVFETLTDLSNDQWQTTVCGFELNNAGVQFLEKLYNFAINSGLVVFIATSNSMISEFFETQAHATVYVVTKQNEAATLRLKPNLTAASLES